MKKFLLFILLVLLFSDPPRAQEVVDVRKITCNQFATDKIADPDHIAIWLNGYDHGGRADMTLDVQTLKANAGKVEEYCLMHPEVLLLQAMKTVLGISYGP